MAGEESNEILDMSAFDDSVFEEQKVEVEVPSAIKQNETTEVAIEDTKKIVDEETQEKVDKDVEEDLVKKKEGDQKSNSPADSEDVFNPLADFLKERGLLSTEKEIKTENDLIEAFKEEIKKSEFSNLNETQKQYLEALEKGIPDEVFHENLKVTSMLNDMTDDMLQEDEALRKQVIIEDLVLSGKSQDWAERQYKRMYDLGETFDEAKTSRDSLKVKQNEWYINEGKQAEQQKVESQKFAEKQLEELKTSVYSQENLFGTFKVNDGLKNKVYDTMTRVVDTVQNVGPVNKLIKHKLDHPIDFDTKLYYLYELTDGFKNINKFVTKATTSATKKLESAVKNSTLIKSGGEISYGNDPEEYNSPIVNIEL